MRLDRRSQAAARGLVAVLALGLLAWGGLSWWGDDDDKRAGGAALQRAERAAQSGQRVMTPKELLNRPFDRLVVIQGTASAEDIREAIGSDWKRADDLAYHCCDPGPIWAFVKSDEVVAYFRPSFAMFYGDGVRAAQYQPNARLELASFETTPWE